ncbi:MAG TPA: OmpA family protein, partial [Geminicoccus sp.]|uniref:OmpA family protein n=1 Tax=Geminicoccus sp. TaxID=2024832 RepID=UPI002E34DD52
LFAVDQATLTVGGLREVNRVASALRDFPEARAIIEGHTDSTGSDAYNLELSDRRANAVRAELVAAGVDPARLVARGMGESYPKAPNDTAAGRQQNRRVEVIVQEGAVGA